MGIINLINDVLWTYILIALLLGCAVWFTLKTRFVQFRMIREMVRLLADSGGTGNKGEKHISSFQAFAISIACLLYTSPQAGLLHLFIKHTSAALTINENADPDVQTDMEAIFNRLVKAREPYYQHTSEGDDDMPARCV